MVSRAVVLGGGGHTGFGWQWGLVTGLQDAGVDLAAADLIVGTSAGSMAAAHLAGGVAPQELMAEITVEGQEPYHPDMQLPHDKFAMALMKILQSARTAAEVRSEFGALALNMEVDGDETVLRQIAAKHLPGIEWPQQRMLIPAIDAETGEFTVFNRDSGVQLVDAIAASCAIPGVWAPVTIGSRKYIDAIVRSPINADLAAGCERVVVIAPIPEIRGLPGAGLEEQLAPVKADGQVIVITPDQESKAAIGRNQQDLSQRPAAARAGFKQVASLVDALSEHWNN